MKNKNDVTNRLREIRKAKGLTQRDVAEKAGMSVSYYTEIELQKKQLNQRRLEDLAKALEVSSSEILFIPGQDESRMAVMSAYDQLDEQSRQALLNMAQTLVAATSTKA